MTTSDIIVQIRHLEKHAGQTQEEFYADDEHTTAVDEFAVSTGSPNYGIWTSIQPGTRFSVGGFNYHLFFKALDFDRDDCTCFIRLFVIRVESE